MANETVINPQLQNSTPTAINNDIIEQYNRQNGITTPANQSQTISENEIICDKYIVVRQLEVTSGEADLYLCKYEDEEYVAKVYKRQMAIKQEVIDKLLTIDSPYVAKLYETGEYNGFPVEILPYYYNGSLQGKQFNEDKLLKTIIPNINEGLKALHDAGIIHKDLKPSNIMLNDDGETVSIIDFGISSAIEGDNTILVTKTGMTFEYSAPETFKGIYYEGSDYYSFGITLFELFCGYVPYANMQPEELEQYILVQKLNYPDDMSPLLQDFISALTYPDITSRNNKENPNRRWTYDEVNRWLNGENLVIPGEGIGNVGKGALPAFEFMGEEITDPSRLVKAFAENWQEGMKQVFRGNVTSYFRTCNQEIMRKCQAAEEEARTENGKDDIIYWKLLYQIDPKLKGFYWKGQTFESIAAFGRDVLDRLWDKDESQFPYYASVLSEKLLSAYVNLTQPKNEKLKKAAAAIEDSYELELLNGTDMKRTYFLMAYTLSGQKLLLLNGEQIRTVGELYNYMRSVYDESYDKFVTLCHKLVDYDGNLDFQLETWLIAIGKQNEIDKWRDSLN
ncbi:MAG: serine/threonine-protein kinase [Butyrivibrio sp.]|nr:serine/threonine-protein kinase [Butyrivibrio sp.]